MTVKMAPMDHAQRDSLEGSQRRSDVVNEVSRRKRDGSVNGKRGNGGNSNGNPNSNNGNNNSGSNKIDDSGKNGDGEDKGHDSPNSPFILPPSSFQAAAKSTSIAQITSTAARTIPTTVVTTSTTPVPSSTSVTSTSSSVPLMSTTPILTSSSFPTTTSILSSITAFTSPADTSSPARKGLNTDGDPTPTKTKNKNTQSTAATALAETAPASTTSSSLELPAQPNNHHGDQKDGLSPTAEHVLIAFGAIGAFIIFMAVVYFVARMKKIDLFAKARGREFSRRGPRGWYGWRGKDSDYTMEAPPKYTGYDESFEYASEQKPVPAPRQVDAFFFLTSTPPLATPASAAALEGADTQRQETVREALLDNPAPFGMSPAQPTEQSATQTPYNQNHSYDPNPSYNQTYNTNATSGGLSRNTSDAYDPAQREVNHLSYLSSLSSGFGDQIIIPETGPTKPANVRVSRQSYRQSRKFSWVTSAQGPQGDRDTVYTNSSIESTPRFRTINSWVAQQTGRVQRQNESNDEVPSMPSIPSALQVGVAPAHQRNQSEDPAFKHHPGDEVELSRGSRIPSTILDKKFGIN